MPFTTPAARRAFKALPLIRLMVGAIALSEGLQKFMLPGLRGPGRFAEIGYPAPEFFGYSVGIVEVVCGLLILLGLYTRWAAILPAFIMLMALITTKLPILFGQGFGPFVVRDMDVYGFWGMAHAMRTDWAMLLGSLVLIFAGGGPWSLDAYRKQSTL